ncbi:MAG: UDP-N-acetylmuramoyl-L-alanine--D-glutamate ligase [Bacteroidales bacterium]|jgi:UDP-N-acetylmuramoylalanine--D-glutamate ligase|nr:UDP-N-acetylmuramoyl-L-alanine--D-glutamate ligase [Bacteroidales bacterium]MCI2122529.1 UDP-N-acetylmuramoyl-L-alanine--D-glutamate ligase [Bacteroidales bacterium]MCI2145570.1 UDP-N-acetylmuramoyl-L-alanine--D-glutamate ligase [Bacteroidales bacterium]
MERIVILGAGESGVGAAVLAKTKGFEVFVSDLSTIGEEETETLKKWDIPYEEGGHTLDRILDAGEIIKSPGIPENAPVIQAVRKKDIPVISEIEFAGRYDKSRKICITGSNGKTTTTSIIYFLLRNAGLNVGLAGNIGKSYAYQVATEKHDYYVLELSSFQLDGMYEFRADIAVILNITPDHLDRYGFKMKNYVNAKFRITQNMRSEDCFIFCSDDEVTVGHLNEIVLQCKKLPFSQEQKEEEGAYAMDGEMHVNVEGEEYRMFLDELSLQGRHNIYNSMAAAITAKVMKISNKIIRESLMSFKNIEHRNEFVRTLHGITFINDSKGTNVDATYYALDCLKANVIWIAGGTDKGNDYSELYALVKEKVTALVCLGMDNRKLHESFGNMIPVIVDTRNAEDAVKAAYELAKPGDTVLLSPCCASFDLFRNYEERGTLFKKAVNELK